MKEVELLFKKISEIETNYANSEKSFWKQNELFTNHINEKISIVNQFELPSELEELERLIDYCNSNIEILTVQIKDEIVNKAILQSYKIALDYLAKRTLKKLSSRTESTSSIEVNNIPKNTKNELFNSTNNEELYKTNYTKDIKEKNNSQADSFGDVIDKIFTAQKQNNLVDKKNQKKGCVLLIGVFIVFSLLLNMCSGYDVVENLNGIITT